MSVVGIDLAGVESRQTGFCVLEVETMRVETSVLYTDDEIVGRVTAVKPRVVAVDAPLCLPRGRRSLEERNSVHLRQCDRGLQRLGIRFFPLTLGPMRKLTRRGIKLKQEIEGEGFEVIEVYPGGAQDVLGIPRKQKGLGRLLRGLRRSGIRGLTKEMNGHELDAVTSAFVGKLYVEGRHESLGDPDEGLMIMPSTDRHHVARDSQR